MKPLSLFYVITGILGIGTITVNDVPADIQTTEQIVFEQYSDDYGATYFLDE